MSDRLDLDRYDRFALTAALRAVLDLHEQIKPRELKGESACAYCSDEDYADWPCDTVRAIEEALNE